MKNKTNIPAIFLAILVFIASNGIVLSEHICNTNSSRDFSMFTNTNCDMEKNVSSCCKKNQKPKNNCCQHKQHFKKLPVEGFTANQIQIKPLEKVILKDVFFNTSSFHLNIISERFISGIPPPDNLFLIKFLLCPTPVGLQTFRC